MVLRSLETPHKVNDLGGGVASGALLLGRGIAGFVTGKPSRLALQPVDGSPGTVVDLAIEPAQDLALLSRDTAVVLGGGGALWSLTDLQGGTKAKQIGRDVRALYARPTGESAIAIGEDGAVLALTASGRDVGVRSLLMRGALAACDLDEHATYALVDGEGGRQLRIHAGATIESGMSNRALLPDAAAGLDRVRGGQHVSVVWKRGDDRVCLVHGAGKLEVKLAQLEGKLADVALLDGALLAAFVDGRLALYDPDAWSRAGDGPLAATAGVVLGGQGRPRVVVAGTVKGAHTIWVGTTAGELFHIGQTAVASQPRPAPRPAEPKPDHAALLAARDRDLADLQAEVQRLTAAHATALEEKEAAHAGVIAEKDAAHAKALEEKDAAHAGVIAEKDAAHAGVIADKDAAHAGVIADKDAAHAKALEEKDAAHAGVIAEKDAAHAKALEEKDAAHAGVIAEKDAAYAKTLAEKEAAHAAALAEKDVAHAAALAAAEQALAEAQARLAAAEQALVERTAELEERTRERDALQQAELDAARKKLSAVEAQLTATAADLDARKKATEALRDEVSRLMEDLGKERERIEKTIPFGSDGLRSIERARETLDGVLSRIQVFVFKRPRD